MSAAFETHILPRNEIVRLARTHPRCYLVHVYGTTYWGQQVDVLMAFSVSTETGREAPIALSVNTKDLTDYFDRTRRRVVWDMLHAGLTYREYGRRRARRHPEIYSG